MIWTTPEFDASFAKLANESAKMAFIDLIISETNQGYANSDMPVSLTYFNQYVTFLFFCQVRIKLHDVKTHPTLHDQPSASSSTMVGNFRNSMPKDELLNCADAAVLLIDDNNTGYCGVAYLDVTSYCGAFSVTKKSCATGYYR